MRCPYVFIDSGRRICRQMTEQGLDGTLDDFDITYYCEGNPNYCFFFRFRNKQTQVTEQLEENKPDAPIVPYGTIVLGELDQPEELSSKQSDKLFKLKRLLHHIV